MKVKNPNYQDAPGPLDGVEQQISDWFAVNPDQRAVSFDALRSHFGKGQEEWPDGAIHAQLVKWGFEVEA